MGRKRRIIHGKTITGWVKFQLRQNGREEISMTSYRIHLDNARNFFDYRLYKKHETDVQAVARYLKHHGVDLSCLNFGGPASQPMTTGITRR